MESYIVCNVLLLLLLTSGYKCQEDPDCFCVDEVEGVRGLSNPLVIISAEDGTDRLFVAEQIGVVWVLLRDESSPGGWSRQPEPYMNISVYYDNEEPGSEEGLLSVRFHPEYTTTGFLYTWYSVYYPIEDRTFTRLSEFRVDPSNPNKADSEYERVLFQLEQLEDNHNGGELIFLNDGSLIITTGDGGHQGDPEDNGLNKMSALGKVLRIDVDSRDEGKQYGIPADNPYINDPDALDELYAIGLRNPWRAFKERTGEANARVFIGDVGQNTWEEVNLLKPGANFGWSAFEGSSCYKPEQCPIYEAEHIKPIFEYEHTEDPRCSSIIQGPMYTGSANPGFNGWLFFADFMCGTLGRLLDNGTSSEWTDMKTLSTCDASTCEAGGLSNHYEKWIITWGEDETGEIYIGAVAGDSLPLPDSQNGHVYKLVHRDSVGATHATV